MIRANIILPSLYDDQKKIVDELNSSALLIILLLDEMNMYYIFHILALLYTKSALKAQKHRAFKAQSSPAFPPRNRFKRISQAA
jgi:hypothetical protein